jgi:hypothetical protein
MTKPLTSWRKCGTGRYLKVMTNSMKAESNPNQKKKILISKAKMRPSINEEEQEEKFKTDKHEQCI